MLIGLAKKRIVFSICATFLKSLGGGADVNHIHHHVVTFLLQSGLVS